MICGRPTSKASSGRGIGSTAGPLVVVLVAKPVERPLLRRESTPRRSDRLAIEFIRINLRVVGLLTLAHLIALSLVAAGVTVILRTSQSKGSSLNGEAAGALGGTQKEG